VAEKRVILRGSDCRKSTDQLIDGHRIESDFPEDHGLRTSNITNASRPTRRRSSQLLSRKYSLGDRPP
jgi:hypothetical protein